jgi:hypothetical protein
MENKQELYHAGNVVPVNAVEPDQYPSRLLYAKVLLTKAQADSQATITHARSNLIALDQYMASLPNSDMKEFNAYVKHQLRTLTVTFPSILSQILVQTKIASPGVMPMRSSFANTVESLSLLTLTIPCGTHINNPAIGCIQALSLRIEGHPVGCVGLTILVADILTL